MKLLFTLLLPVLLSISTNAQFLDNHSIESIEDKFSFQKNYKNSVLQAKIRSPFILDSAYVYLLPTEQLVQKFHYSFNDLGSSLGYYILGFELSTNDWENQFKIEYERDINDQIITLFNYNVNPNTFDWEEFLRFDYTWDANGNNIVSTYSQWNDVTSSFINNLKWEYNFDGSNLQIDSYTSIWYMNDWTNHEYTTYTNDSDGNLSEEILQYWSSADGIYKNYLKWIYEYDTDQNLISKIYQDWDQVDSIWENTIKLDYIFENGRLTNYYNSSWVNSPSGFQWLAHYQTQYTFDSYGNNYQDFNSEYNFDNEMWEETLRFDYFYTDLETTVQTLEDISLTCHLQNPIQPGQIINCQDLDVSKNYTLILFDVSGKVLLEKSFKGDVEIVLPSFLESGMYFMNVLEDGRLVLKEKVVVID